MLSKRFVDLRSVTCFNYLFLDVQRWICLCLVHWIELEAIQVDAANIAETVEWLLSDGAVVGMVDVTRGAMRLGWPLDFSATIIRVEQSSLAFFPQCRHYSGCVMFCVLSDMCQIAENSKNVNL